MRRVALLLTLLPPTIALAEPAVSQAELDALAAATQADAAEPPAPAAPLGGGSNPDISLILDVAAAYFDGQPDQTGAHDPQDAGFTLQQLEMHIASNVDPFFRLEANLVFTPSGVEIEEAYGQTLALPGNLQLRAGQFLTRFGRLNPTHLHRWHFVDQPLVNGAFFGAEGSRGIGAELGWLAPLPWVVEWVGSVTSAGEGHEHGAEEAGEATDEDHDAHPELVYTAALEQFFPLGPAWSLAWGLSGQLGPGEHGHHSALYGTDIYLRLRPPESVDRTSVGLQVELMYRTGEGHDGDTSDWGGYAELVWDIDPTWQVGARYGLVSGLDPDALHDAAPHDAAPHDAAQPERRRISAQITLRPSHFSRLRLQASRGDRGEAHTWAGFLALELLIGAHGAHSF